MQKGNSRYYLSRSSPPEEHILAADCTPETSETRLSEIPVPDTSLDDKAFAYHLSHQAQEIAVGLEKRLLAQPIDRTTVNYEQDLKSLSRARRIQKKIQAYDEKSSRLIISKAARYKLVNRDLVPRVYRQGKSIGTLVTDVTLDQIPEHALSKSITSLKSETDQLNEMYNPVMGLRKIVKLSPEPGHLFRKRLQYGQSKSAEFKSWRNGWKAESDDRIRCDGTAGDIDDLFRPEESLRTSKHDWPTNYDIKLPESPAAKTSRVAFTLRTSSRQSTEPTEHRPLEVIQFEGESPELKQSQASIEPYTGSVPPVVPSIDLQEILDEPYNLRSPPGKSRPMKQQHLQDKYLPTASVIEEVDEAATAIVNKSTDKPKNQARKRSGESSSTLKQSLEDYQLKYRESKSPKRLSPSMKQTPRLEVSRGIAANEYIKGWKQPKRFYRGTSKESFESDDSYRRDISKTHRSNGTVTPRVLPPVSRGLAAQGKESNQKRKSKPPSLPVSTGPSTEASWRLNSTRTWLVTHHTPNSNYTFELARDSGFEPVQPQQGEGSVQSREKTAGRSAVVAFMLKGRVAKSSTVKI